VTERRPSSPTWTSIPLAGQFGLLAPSLYGVEVDEEKDELVLTDCSDPDPGRDGHGDRRGVGAGRIGMVRRWPDHQGALAPIGSRSVGERGGHRPGTPLATRASSSPGTERSSTRRKVQEA